MLNMRKTRNIYKK